MESVASVLVWPDVPLPAVAAYQEYQHFLLSPEPEQIVLLFIGSAVLLPPEPVGVHLGDLASPVLLVTTSIACEVLRPSFKLDVIQQFPSASLDTVYPAILAPVAGLDSVPVPSKPL